jgi:hypothetical protein
MNDKPKRDATIQTKIIPSGQAVLLSQNTEWAYTLNPLAALVWEFCDGDNTIDNIAERIRSIPEFPDRPTLREDICHLLAELEDAGYLQS